MTSVLSKKSPMTIGLALTIVSLIAGAGYSGSLYVDNEIEEALKPVAQQVAELKDTLEVQRVEQKADMQTIYNLLLNMNGLEAKELNGGLP